MEEIFTATIPQTTSPRAATLGKPALDKLSVLKPVESLWHFEGHKANSLIRDSLGATPNLHTLSLYKSVASSHLTRSIILVLCDTMPKGASRISILHKSVCVCNNLIF
ncbi:hypothetical protein AAHE18_06G006200 [Arachis hypogaea]